MTPGTKVSATEIPTQRAMRNPAKPLIKSMSRMVISIKVLAKIYFMIVDKFEFILDILTAFLARIFPFWLVHLTPKSQSIWNNWTTSEMSSDTIHMPRLKNNFWASIKSQNFWKQVDLEIMVKYHQIISYIASPLSHQLLQKQFSKLTLQLCQTNKRKHQDLVLPG